MLKITNGTNISITKGDTVELNVSARESIATGSTLDFVIAKNEEEDTVTKTSYTLNVNGVFCVMLPASTTEGLDIGNYIYKMTLKAPDGSIATRKSGYFIVKWGA